MSELANRYDVEIARSPKIVPGHNGSKVRYIQYRANESARAKLAVLLGLKEAP